VFDIGATLREARERRGLSLDDVQQSLHFRVRYLTALEEEHWDLLPGGEAYAKGFLRTYAEFLGLDGTLYIDEFNERVAAEDEQPIVPESLAPRRTRRRLLVRAIVGVFVLAFAVFAAAAMRPSSAPGTHVDVAAAAAATPKPAAQRGMPVAPVVLPAAGRPKPVTAAIRATTARSWLSVRVGGPTGKELFRGFLNRGHELSYPLGRDVWMRIGRPHSVVVSLGRRTVNGLPGTPANLLLTRFGPQAG
jgi:cytoskeleton protein RodZ